MKIIRFPTDIGPISPVKTYAPINACIYCGHDKVALFPEHIIPFGIAGDAYILPRASCKKCGDLTGKFEGEILRRTWWPFRCQIGAPTYRPRQRPKDFTLRKVRKDGDVFIPIETTQKPTAEFPRSIIMMEFGPPGILDGRPVASTIEGKFWCQWEDKISNDMTDQQGILLGQFNPGSFCRMLAKIAHAYATAEHGYSTFEPLLKNLIKGKSQTLTHLIGAHPAIPPPATGVLHELSSQIITRGGGERLLVVDVRLFSFFGTPRYQVVAGRL